MLSALGIGAEENWQNLLEQSVPQIRREYKLKDGSMLNYPVYAAPVPDIRDVVGAATYEWMNVEGLTEDLDFVFLAAVGKLCLQQANFTPDGHSRVSLVIAHENLGVNRLIDKMISGDTEKQSPLSPLKAYEQYQQDFFRLQSFPHLFNLSKVLGVHGMSYTINNACASGLYALELGRMMIASGQADAVVVACSDYAHATEHLWLSGRGFSSEKGQIRPFDARRDGSILGDGAAAILLESSDHARKRRVRPWCVYKGGSFRQDTWHLSLPEVTEHSYAGVIADVIDTHNVAGTLDLLIPHGAGIPLWDRFEMKEIETAHSRYGDYPAITAFKGSIGHTLGANALLEAALLMMCIKHDVIPGTVNHTTPDPHLPFSLLTETQEKRVRHAMKTVTAYGGFQAAALFEKINEELGR